MLRMSGNCTYGGLGMLNSFVPSTVRSSIGSKVNTENLRHPLLPNISMWSSFDDSSDTKHHEPDPGIPLSNLKQALTVSSAL